MSRRVAARSQAAEAAREQEIGAVDVAAMVWCHICDREPWEEDTGSARRLPERLDRAALGMAMECRHPESDWVCGSCNTKTLLPWKKRVGQQKVAVEPISCCVQGPRRGLCL